MKYLVIFNLALICANMSKISLTQSLFSDGLRVQMREASNKLVWGTIFFLIFISILDFLLIQEVYLELVLLNISCIAIIFTSYYLLSKIQKHTLILHLSLLTLSFLFTYSISITDEVGMIFYLAAIAVAFVSYNSIAIWKTKDAMIQLILLCLLIVLFEYLEIVNSESLLYSGAYTTLAVCCISIIFPSIRLLSLKDRIIANHQVKEKIDETENNNKLLERDLERKVLHIRRVENIIKVFQHDIKNKLSSIESLLDLIEIEELYDKGKEEHDYLDMIKLSLKGANNQNRALMEEINADENTGALEIDKEYIDIHEIIEDLRYKFFEKTSSRNIQLKSELKAANSMILVNKRMTEIAIYNIFKYSIDFSKNNDVLEITSRNERDITYLAVTNRNTGMSITHLESFFKNINDYKLKDIQQSQGLGLSIAKNHIELMDGQLQYSASNSLGFEFIAQFQNIKPS